MLGRLASYIDPLSRPAQSPRIFAVQQKGDISQILAKITYKISICNML
jgi:hypothetical protein